MRAIREFQDFKLSSWLHSIPIYMLTINIYAGMTRALATLKSNIQSPRFFFLPFHFWKSGCNVQLNTVYTMAHQIRRTSPGIIRTFSPHTTVSKWQSVIVVLFDRGGREKDTTKSVPLWPAAAVFGWLGIYKRRVVNTSYYAGEKLFIFFTFFLLRSLHTPVCLIT